MTDSAAAEEREKVLSVIRKRANSNSTTEAERKSDEFEAKLKREDEQKAESAKGTDNAADARVKRAPPTFEEMDDGSRHEVARSMCRFISEKYWPDLDEDQIALMADTWVGE